MPSWLSLWDYSDPVASEVRLGEAAEAATDPDEELVLLTQVARARGLQKHYEAAQDSLDLVEMSLPEGDAPSRFYWLLETGRVLRSSGRPHESRPWFEAAQGMAERLGLEHGAIDAAHMVALVAPPEEALELHDRAIAMANEATDPDARRWRASLLNNQAWTRFERGEHELALGLFAQAVDARREMGDEKGLAIAQWCQARCLRELGRNEEAWAIQQVLHATGEPDGFVAEELAYLSEARGDMPLAALHAFEATTLLKVMDPDWPEQEPERYAKLLELQNR